MEMMKKQQTYLPSWLKRSENIFICKTREQFRIIVYGCNKKEDIEEDDWNINAER